MKKIISAVAVAAVAASMSAPAFAVLTPDGEPVIQGYIMLLSEGVEEGKVVIGEGDAETPIVVLPEVKEPLFTRQDVTVTADNSIDFSKYMIFDIDGNAKTSEDLKEGDAVITFTNTSGDEADLNYAVITSEDVDMNVTVDGFTVSETLGEYVDSQNFLAINVSEDTEIVGLEGNKLTADDIADKLLMVFYDKMTMSIPAIATPSRVIVLGDYEPTVEPTAEPEATEEPVVEPEYLYEINVNQDDIITQGEKVYIPVRKYAESLGFEVTWYGEDKSVSVGTEQMGVKFQIGVDSYSKVKMTPFVFGAAPQLINDTTYVPVEFFEQVLDTKVEIFTNTEAE